MPGDDAPNDDDVRETYNFAPGSYGIVYRADVPERRAPANVEGHDQEETTEEDLRGIEETKYKLQAMKWGRSTLRLLPAS